MGQGTFILMKFLPFTITNFQVHFVEMDPWVVSDVLRPNLEWTGFLDVSVIHTVRVEKFIERAKQLAGMCCCCCSLSLSLSQF